MKKIHYTWGCMGSGKSLLLRRTYYNYIEKGLKVAVYKPTLDNRESSTECFIATRADKEKVPAEWVNDEDNLFLKIYENKVKNNITAVLVDEVQFLSLKQIDQLISVGLELDIPVMVYGLKTDFKGELFPAISRLLAVCIDIEESRSLCWCGERSTQNARVVNDKIVRTGNQVEIGGNERYTALCLKHFIDGKVRNS